jgi:D-alanyl-D-alanine carboxypeptidase
VDTGAVGSRLQRDVDALVSLGVVGVQARLDSVDGRYEVVTGGVADLQSGRPVPPDGHFRMASATKTFVSTMVLQLVGENRLGLTDPVERPLPGVVAGPGFNGADLTIGQLLQHTSGLHDDYPDFDTAEDYYRDRYRIRTPEELISRAMQHRLDFPPGTAWGYSNTGYLLLGLVIERVTGRPWYEEVGARILQPLQLRHISFPGDSPDLPDPHAHGHQLFSGTDELVDVTTVIDANASDGLIGTTADMNRFYQALLAGQLLKSEQQEQLLNTVPVDEVTQQFWPGGRYGLGLASRPLSRGGNYWGHEGGQLGFITLNGVTDTGSRAITLSMSAALVDHAQQQEELASTLIDNALCA